MYWLRERIHPTWQVTAITLGFVAGTAIAPTWWIPVWAGCTAGTILIVLAVWRQRRFLLLAAFIGGSFLGLARGAWALGDLAAYQPYYGHSITVNGVVTDDISIMPSGAHVSLGHVQINGKSFSGKVFATVTGANQVRRSDNLVVRGMLDSGFGGYAATIQGQVQHTKRPIPGDIPLEVRNAFAVDIHKAIGEPEASLGIGYLLGQKSMLPTNLIDALKIAGLTHIVVASGYNLTILVRIGRRLFAKISKYLAMLTGVVLIVGFIAMTGLSPSMTRAGLVSGLGLWAWYFGRRFHPITLLGIAAAITVAINPSYVWGDLGWLLSFAAFAGVMIIAPIVTAYFFGEEKAPFIGQLLIETMAAQIATLPIMIIAFHQFSLIAPIANLLILPFIPLAMLLVAGSGFGAMIAPNIAHIIGWPAEQLLHLQVIIINWCADIPWALTKPEWQWWGVLVYITVVAGVVMHMKLISGYKLYRASVVE